MQAGTLSLGSLGEKEPRFQSQLKEFNEEGEYSIIDCRKTNNYGKEWAIGPSEFLYLIDNAELVMTDSFHAVVFSIIFHTKFLIFERPGINMNSRVMTLIKKLDLEDYKEKTARDIMNDGLDFKKSDLMIKKYQSSSLEFLKRCLDVGI